MEAREEEIQKMGHAGASGEHFQVFFSNAVLTEPRSHQELASSSHIICTTFALKKTGSGTLGQAFARKEEGFSLSSQSLASFWS